MSSISSSLRNETQDSAAVTEVKTELMMDSDRSTNTTETSSVAVLKNNGDNNNENISQEGQQLLEPATAVSSAEDAAAATLECSIKQEKKSEAAILDLSRIPATAADDDNDEADDDDSADGIRYLLSLS